MVVMVVGAVKVVGYSGLWLSRWARNLIVLNKERQGYNQSWVDQVLWAADRILT